MSGQALLTALLDSMNNSSDFWKEVKKHRKLKTTVNKIYKRQWTGHTVISMTFSIEHAENIFSGDGHDEPSEEETFYEIVDSEINEQAVKKAIKRLKTGKAAGPDNILAEMLKPAEPDIVSILKAASTHCF